MGEILHEYCDENSETLTEFWNSLVVTKNVRIIFWPTACVKNQHKMHYNRKCACKRGVILAKPQHKICCTSTFREKFCFKYCLFFISFNFMQIVSSLILFFLNLRYIFLIFQILQWKTPYPMLYSAGSSQLLHIGDFFMLLVRTKLVKNFVKVLYLSLRFPWRNSTKSVSRTMWKGK